MHKDGTPDCGQFFYSKRNKVIYDCETACVKKVFTEAEDYRTEKKVFEQLKKAGTLKVPAVLEADDASQTLWLEYLEDSTLLTLLMEDESQGNMDAAIEHLKMLFEWLDGFYRVMAYRQIMTDVNFRNFILHEDRLYGFDFETVAEGDPARERCMVLAMYLMYDPMETEFKEQVCQRMMDWLGMKEEAWSTIGHCIREIDSRRKRHS